MKTGLLLLALLSGFACEAQTLKEKRALPDQEFEKVVRGLIEKLAVSPDPPTIRPWESPSLIPRHGETISRERLDKAARMREADVAARELKTLGLRTIPFLLESMRDRRESTNFGKNVLGATVGFVCRTIVERLGTFCPEWGHTYESGLYSFLDSDCLDAWWAEREGKTQAEIEAEAVVFSLAMVRYHRDLKTDPRVTDRSDTWEAICIERLKEIEVPDYEARAAAILQQARASEFPGTPEGWVAALRVEGRDYLAKRLATMMSRRAALALRQGEEGVIDALVRGTGDPVVGDACFWILREKIDGWVYGFWPDLGLLERERVNEWWEARKGKSLKELRAEALRHALRRAEEKEWKTGENKDHVIGRLRKALADSGGHPDTYEVGK